MSDLKLATYQSPQGARAGVIVGDTIFDIAAIDRPSGLCDDARRAARLGCGARPHPGRRQDRGRSKRGGQPLSGTKLLPPVTAPGGIFCAGANFTDHMMEMAKVQNLTPEPDPHSLGLKPWHFIKAMHCLAAPDSTVKLPAYSKMVDWEAELTAVIGRPARNVSIENALAHVAGYTVANDLSARDFTKRPHVADTSPFKYDWLGQKNFEGACPLGPWIVPADAIPDPQNVGLKLWVNDVDQAGFPHQQDDLHAGRADRASVDPRHLAAGRPDPHRHAGRRRPGAQEFLKRGDVVKVWVEGVGTLTNTCG